MKFCEWQLSKYTISLPFGRSSIQFFFPPIRYIRLLTNVLEWQKAQDCNNIRIKCEPVHFISYSTSGHKNQSHKEGKAEMNRSLNRSNFNNRHKYQIPQISCDKNGNDLLIIAPVGKQNSHLTTSCLQNSLNATINTITLPKSNGGILSNGSFHYENRTNKFDKEDKDTNTHNRNVRSPVKKRIKITPFEPSKNLDN